jgi:RNA polymerase sigma-70 factor, ECF subfamily
VGKDSGIVDDFDAFVEDHYGKVLRTVTLALGDRERAAEATQEAFLRAFRDWRRVRSMAKPTAWLLVVAINSERRRWRRAPVVVAVAEPMGDSVEDHAGVVATAVSVRDALDRLTIRQRAAVVLRYLADLPISDIADALGCAEGTVRATLHQSLAKLRVDLAETDL